MRTLALINYPGMKRLRRPLLQLIVEIVLLAAVLTLSIDCSAQATPRRSLLALSKANHTLSIVDPATLKILATIPVGQDPHELVASTDGKTAYVCIYGGGSFYEI